MSTTLSIFPTSTIQKLHPTVRDYLLQWIPYMDNEVVFNDIGSDIHTRDHCARVLLFAISLGYKIFGDRHDVLDALAHASVFHDTRRLDDFLDVGHGARAAVYYSDFCAEHGLPCIEEARLAMKYHDIDDSKGLAAISALPDADTAMEVYRIFKDADALDRFRLGRGGLDPTFLRHIEALEMIPFARQIVETTIDADILNKKIEEIDDFKREHKLNNMLIIVDPQYDFIDGSLPVPGAAEAMDRLSRFLNLYGLRYDVIVITADWHTYNHCSFVEEGGIWPRHCVAFSYGASIYQAVLDTANKACDVVKVLTKGTDTCSDEYSVFKNKASAECIHNLIGDYGIGKIDICGIAGDVCVLNTLSDATELYSKEHINVLLDFSPSLDGGSKLKEAVETLKTKQLE